jgi:hypothetical protein
MEGRKRVLYAQIGKKGRWKNRWSVLVCFFVTICSFISSFVVGGV